MSPVGPESPATKNIINNTTSPTKARITNIARKNATLNNQLIKKTRNKRTRNTPNPNKDIPSLFSPIISGHNNEIINGNKTK